MNPEARRKPIIEGLAYERSCVVFGSLPGIGKSSITLQAMLELSAGLPVFGAFPSTPTRIHFIQKERTVDEILERVEAFEQFIPWKKDNIVIDSSLQSFNLAREDNFSWIIERIKAFNPGIIVIDPIGSGTPGLSSDEGANKFCNFLTMMQSDIGACHWLNHHSVKDSYSSDGKRIEKQDPFYGSQWLKAHVTGSFLMTETETGTKFVNKKDSHSNLLKQFELAYDPETLISTAKVENLNARDRIKQFCNAKFCVGVAFTFRDILLGTRVSRTQLRGHLQEPLFKDFLIRTKASGKATLYKSSYKV